MAVNWIEVNKKEHLDGLRNDFASSIAELATVQNPETGFIRIEEINQIIKPSLLKNAAQITKGLFLDRLPPELQPELIVGIPNRGNFFATALGLETGIPIAVSKTLKTGPSDSHEFWLREDYNNPNITIVNGIASVSNPGEFYRHQIFGLQEGQRIIFADDFCAQGQATEIYIQASKELGITPIFVYMIAKDFPDLKTPQIGYRKILTQGLPAFAAVTLTGIQDGRVIASSNFEKQLINKGL